MRGDVRGFGMSRVAIEERKTRGMRTTRGANGGDGEEMKNELE